MRTFLSFKSTSVMASLLERDIVYRIPADVEERWLILIGKEELKVRIFLKGILRQVLMKEKSKVMCRCGVELTSIRWHSEPLVGLSELS